jgi:hypothetical protein
VEYTTETFYIILVAGKNCPTKRAQMKGEVKGAKKIGATRMERERKSRNTPLPLLPAA